MKRLLMICLICILLCGCAAQEKSVTKEFWAMDTYMNAKVWGGDREEAASQVMDLVSELSNTWSAANEKSLLGMINAGVDVELTAEQAAILAEAEALSQRTGGAFDPKMRSVSRAWGFYNEAHRVATQAEIDAALLERQWDLGAVMKGYAARKAVAQLETMDVDRALLNFGGNVQTYGEKPEGEPWQIAIQNPEGGDHLGIISVVGTKAIVTSGSYQRYFIINNVRYHHILDPKTGYPADSGLVSVTVVCDDGMKADAFSTALFVMGLEEGSRFWQESDDFEAVFVLTTGEIYATEGAMLSGCEYEVIRREN